MFASRLASVPKTLGALGALCVALPFNLALTSAALVRLGVARPQAPTSTDPKTVLISGGKMTKALLLARSFHAAGHRVILVESSKYRWTGHRFSRAVDRFYTVPKPQQNEYAQALLDIVIAEGVDLFVPVCSPIASFYDASAKSVLAEFCDVLHEDLEMVRKLDDKYEFAIMAERLGLPVPDSHRITTPNQVAVFRFDDAGADYILKSIPYDPLHRLDLTTLPRPSRQATVEFARSKPISRRSPWVMQAMIRGQEYCTHATVRDGVVQAYCCCESSPFQVNYEMVDKPEIESWVRGFVEPLRLTGQISFDFIQSDDGTVYAIECNPRTHSAITMFYNHPGLARAYLESDVETITPLSTSRPTYWTYHEVWRLITEPSRIRSRLRTIARGTDAIFDWDDPLPFFMVHHVQIPSLLLHNLWRLKPWIRIDFNIGKLVEPAGD